MKKVLFASTALLLTAGFASAEVSLSGSGRMGFIYDSNQDDRNDLSWTSRARVEFTLSGSSDSGIEFGGKFRADNASGANRGQAGSVYVSGAYGKLSMGDVDGAAEAAVGDLYEVGLTGIGDFNETWYLNSGFDSGDLFQGNIFAGAYALPAALYEYSINDFTLYVGIGNPGGERFVDEALGTPVDVFLDNQWSVGMKYANDMFAVGVGYERVDLDEVVAGEDSIDQWLVSGEYMFGNGAVKAVYGDISDLDIKQYGISGKYTFGAYENITMTGFVRKVEGPSDAFADDDSAVIYGLGGEYDLGGGASFKAGIRDTDVDGSDAVMDAGINFTF